MCAYNTKQRAEILEFFKRNFDKSFSAGEIISSDEISAGEATVYRCLSLLSKEGLLRRFTENGAGGALYQYAGSECCRHFHLKCVECGGVWHMDCDFMDDIRRHIIKDHDFYVDNSKTVLFGVCGKCRAAKSGLICEKERADDKEL